MKLFYLIVSKILDRGIDVADRERIVKSTFYSLFIQGISILLVFAANLIMVKVAGASSYSQYVNVFNWVSIFGIIVLRGNEDLAIAKIPRYQSDRDYSSIVYMVKKFNRDTFLVVFVAASISIVIVYFFGIENLISPLPLFVTLSAAVYFNATLILNQYVLQALNHVRSSQIVERILKPLLTILFLVFFSTITSSVNRNQLVVLVTGVLGICSMVVIGILFVKVRKYTSNNSLQCQEENLTRKASYFFFISLLYILSTKITMLILPFYTPQKDIGIFNISYRFADILIFPFFLMHNVLPQLFAKHSLSKAGSTEILFNEATRIMLLLSIPLLLINVFFGHLFLGLFGNEFKAGYTSLIYISLSQFSYSLFGPTNTVLMMQNNEKYSAGCLLLFVLVLSITSYILIPRAGISGGALAILISTLVYNIILAILTYRLHRIVSPFLAFFTKI